MTVASLVAAEVHGSTTEANLGAAGEDLAEAQSEKTSRVECLQGLNDARDAHPPCALWHYLGHYHCSLH